MAYTVFRKTTTTTVSCKIRWERTLEKLDIPALQLLVGEMPQYVKKKQLMTNCCANLKGIK